jgi:hypothetical protein
MKVTAKDIKKIIEEELDNVLFEQRNFDGMTGFPLTQKGARAVQNQGSENPQYKKYKSLVDKIASGTQTNDQIIQIANKIRKAEDLPSINADYINRKSKSTSADPTGDIPAEDEKTEETDQTNYSRELKDVSPEMAALLNRDRFVDDEPKAKPKQTQSLSKNIANINKQLTSIIMQLPKEIEPKVEPNIAKMIEFLTKVSMFLQRKK